MSEIKEAIEALSSNKSVLSIISNKGLYELIIVLYNYIVVNNYTNIDFFCRMCFYFIFPTVYGLGGDGQSVRLDSGLEAQAMLNHTHTHTHTQDS